MTIGLILAGGRSRRFGGAKADARLGGVPLAQWVRDRLRSQATEILVSANERPPSALSGLTTIADDMPDFRGPLAGILAGLEWIKVNRPDNSRCVSVAVDAPFIPRDLVRRLARGSGAERAAVAVSGGRLHPTMGLWPVALAPRLRSYLVEQERNDAAGFAASVNAVAVEFSAEPFDPFFNINTTEDLAEAERLCRRFGLAVSD